MSEAVKEVMSCPDRIVAHFGGVAKTVEALLIDRQTVYLWQNQGYVPPSNALIVEKATDGAITIREMLEEAHAINPPKSKLRDLVNRGA